jgi:hypothetical protein
MGKANVLKNTTGRERAEADTDAALSVAHVEIARDHIKEEEQVQREKLIAQSHEMAGQIKAAMMFSKFGDVSRLVWLRQVKESKAYKAIGTWDYYCKYLGLDRRTIDEGIQNLRSFGEDFLETVAKMSVGYHELRKLRQMSHNGDVIIDTESVTIGDEQIPLTKDHSEDLQAAIESLLESKEKETEAARMEVKVKDRQLKSKDGQVKKLEKTLAKLEAKAEEHGYTPGEEAFIKKMEAARVTIDGFLMDFDTDYKGTIPEDATPRMQAAFMTTLGYLRRVITAMFDTASEVYGTADMDDDWVPPHLRPEEEAVAVAAADEDADTDAGKCAGCNWHKGMINPAKGVKIPGASGKCTRPQGLCDPENPDGDL